MNKEEDNIEVEKNGHLKKIRRRLLAGIALLFLLTFTFIFINNSFSFSDLTLILILDLLYLIPFDLIFILTLVYLMKYSHPQITSIYDIIPYFAVSLFLILINQAVFYSTLIE